MSYAMSSGTTIGMQNLERRFTPRRLRDQSYTPLGLSAPIPKHSAKIRNVFTGVWNETCAGPGLHAAMSGLGDSALCMRFGFRKIAATTGAFRGSSGPPSGLPFASKCVSCSGSSTSSGLSLGLNSKGHHVYLDKIGNPVSWTFDLRGYTPPWPKV